MGSRLSGEMILQQAEELSQNSPIPELFHIIPYLVMVLNQQRQIIYSNNGLLQILGIIPLHERLGWRPGELFRCIHSCKTPGGCGTTPYCTVCGAHNAILEVQQTGQPVARECLLTTSDGEHPAYSHELSIHAAPAGEASQNAVLFMVRDISEEKRKKVLEQLFLHDLLNSAGAARGFIELTHGTDNLPELQELCGCAQEAVDLIIDEIQSHRDLVNAEKGELAVHMEAVYLNGIMSSMIEAVRRNTDRAAEISYEWDCHAFVESDQVLLRRVVGNMLKNAAEASGMDAVRVQTRKDGDCIAIRVHNRIYMPPEVQLQVFKRSFSTKGEGRGYGTYGMKLFGERYLGGKVTFQSDPEWGTVFTFLLPRVDVLPQ
ncbi:MAG: histidine kinase [Paenibacillaceae bacterium]|jgi:signal transduction histidine kinase|nr:histidine kinase [Paenibacillaceae bacterium]